MNKLINKYHNYLFNFFLLKATYPLKQRLSTTLAEHCILSKNNFHLENVIDQGKCDTNSDPIAFAVVEYERLIAISSRKPIPRKTHN